MIDKIDCNKLSWLSKCWRSKSTKLQQITVSDCNKLIQRAKCRNQKSTKIKVFQIEYFKDRHPKIFQQTLGVLICAEELEKVGYICELEQTDKQVTVGYNIRGEVNKCSVRSLTTVNLVIKW